MSGGAEPHGFGQLGKLLSLRALPFSFVKSWAWGLGMGGKIMCQVSSGSDIFIFNSWNLHCVSPLFTSLKEISEN